MKKRLFILAAAFMLIASLAACGSGGTEVSSDEDWYDESYLYGTSFTAEITDLDEESEVVWVMADMDGEEYEFAFWTLGTETGYCFSSGEEAAYDDLEIGQTVTMTLDEDGFITEIVIESDDSAETYSETEDSADIYSETEDSDGEVSTEEDISGETVSEETISEAEDDNDVDVSSETVSSEADTSDADTEVNTTSAIDEEIDYDYAYSYSEGLAWVEFSVEDDSGEEICYYGVIDKSGQMIFRIQYSGATITETVSSPDYIYEVTDYSNGYAYVIYGNPYGDVDQTYVVIDTEGVKMSSYQEGEDYSIAAYGDGYVVTSEYYADFSTVGYVYTIYSPSGEVLKTYESEEELSVRFCGNGVFQCGDELYFAKIQNAVTSDEVDFDDVYFYDDDIALIDISGDYIYLIDSEGEISKIASTYDGSAIVYNNYCVIYKYKDKLTVYDLTDQSFTEIISEDSYGDQIMWDDLGESTIYDGFTYPVIDESGCIALTLEGADGLKYVVLFDTDGNMISDPISIYYSDSAGVMTYALSESRLIVAEIEGSIGNYTSSDASVYDENGNLLFTISDKGYNLIAPYSEGVAVVSSDDYTGANVIGGTHALGGVLHLADGEIPTYLDTDGNLLFDSIDLSNVIEYSGYSGD